MRINENSNQNHKLLARTIALSLEQTQSAHLLWAMKWPPEQRRLWIRIDAKFRFAFHREHIQMLEIVQNEAKVGEMKRNNNKNNDNKINTNISRVHFNCIAAKKTKNRQKKEKK